MIAHITYLSESALQRKFGRNLQNSKFFFEFETEFQIESYLSIRVFHSLKDSMLTVICILQKLWIILTFP